MSDLIVQVICGFGIGSSTLLKIKIQGILAELGVEAKVFTGALSSSASCDVIFTTKELAEKVMAQFDVSVIVISNLMDSAEIREKTEKFINNR